MPGAPAKSRTRHRTLWVALLATWTLCVGIGFAALMKYGNTPGPRVALPAHWPAAFPFHPEPQGITLIVSLHPRCPCSHATVGELARLMTRQQAGVRAYLLMVKPADAPDRWEVTDLWNQTRDIPGVVVMLDRDGVYSRQLGAQTSGQVFAFDSTGRALFSGGITPARGHMGDSAGSDAVAALLSGRQTARQTAPVFGCALNSPSQPSVPGARP
jgi:hypothetical protein